jgi:coenzyme F420-reducing hydrogenase delta subunit
MKEAWQSGKTGIFLGNRRRNDMYGSGDWAFEAKEDKMKQYKKLIDDLDKEELSLRRTGASEETIKGFLQAVKSVKKNIKSFRE